MVPMLLKSVCVVRSGMLHVAAIAFRLGKKVYGLGHYMPGRLTPFHVS